MIKTTYYDKSLPLVFNHVPKTSGKALKQGIAQTIAATYTLDGFDLSLFGAFRRFEGFGPYLRPLIYLTSAELPSDARWIAGHFARSTTVEAYPSAQHLTVLREGRVRILSHWLYWRSLPYEATSMWGDWGRVLRKSHYGLGAFLTLREVAAQIDNAALRNLLWPHPLIADNGFIDERHDDALVEEAIEKLEDFAHVDVIENPNFKANLFRWFDRPVPYQRLNETGSMPPMLRGSLEEELSTAALDLLDSRSRLDDRLWEHIARRTMSFAAAHTLRQRTYFEALRRYARLMAA